MKEVSMAIPTNGKKGMNDTVSEVLGRAITFTIIDFKEGSIDNVDVLVNPALSYKHGAGPIVIKMLIDKAVNIITYFNSKPLENPNIKMIKVKSGITVTEAIKESMKNLWNEIM